MLMDQPNQSEPDDIRDEGTPELDRWLEEPALNELSLEEQERIADKVDDGQRQRAEAEGERLETNAVRLYGALEERHPLDDLAHDVQPNRNPNFERLVEPGPVADPALVDRSDAEETPESDCN